jgi:hypothetical protein
MIELYTGLSINTIQKCKSNLIQLDFIKSKRVQNRATREKDTVLKFPINCGVAPLTIVTPFI